jgi:hypothetical protein
LRLRHRRLGRPERLEHRKRRHCVDRGHPDLAQPVEQPNFPSLPSLSSGDNGGSAEGQVHGTPNEYAFFNGVEIPVERQMPFIDAWGWPTTYPNLAVGWTWAFGTPYQWTKQVASHFGGTRNGMAMSWPRRITDRGGIRHQFHHVIDIALRQLDDVGRQRSLVARWTSHQSGVDRIAPAFSRRSFIISVSTKRPTSTTCAQSYKALLKQERTRVTAVPIVRARSTDFGQVGCEPQQVLAVLKPAFDLEFSEAYLIGQVRRSGEKGPPESDFRPFPRPAGQQVCPENPRKPATQRGVRSGGECGSYGNWRRDRDSHHQYATRAVPARLLARPRFPASERGRTSDDAMESRFPSKPAPMSRSGDRAAGE